MSVTEAATLHDKRFPGENAAYRAARDELLEAERELRRQIETVAAQRRALPPGGRVAEDYVFEEGDPAAPAKLSDLFGDKQDLLLYSYMYGPKAAQPCPYCTSMLDGLDGQIPHIAQQAAVAVAARSPIGRIRDFAASRGWRNLRLISSAGNSYSNDYFGEDPNGNQWPILNVFTRRGGEIRHAWATELAFLPSDPGQSPRHVDSIWPLWNALDMTPGGRGDFDLKLSY